jgi:hypothetical protein
MDFLLPTAENQKINILVKAVKNVVDMNLQQSLEP